MKRNRHGADLYALEKKYHYRPEDIRDFSSNINPLGPSPKALDAAAKNIRALCRYPDPEYRKLKAAIADYVHVSPEEILLGSGTSELIQAAIHSIHPRRALLNSPCYSEYERELKKIGDAPPGSPIFLFRMIQITCCSCRNLRRSCNRVFHREPSCATARGRGICYRGSRRKERP